MLTEAMPERLRLMVTLAQWCALRFGEIVELRRGDIDLGARGDPHPPRGGAHQGRVHASPHPKSDAGVRDVAIPPHVIPLIEAHLAKHVDSGRDSLIFAADDGGASTAVHAVPALVSGAEKAASAGPAVPRSAAQRCGARGGDRRIPGRTDGPPWSFDAAGRDALPARRGGP